VSVLVVDTSSWISYFKGAGSIEIDDSLQEGRLYLPPIVASELTSARAPESKKNALLDFLRELPLISTDIDHWFRVGELRLRAAKKGLSISTPDAHIAQCCLDLSARLLSEDLVFKKIKKAVCSDLLVID